MLNDCGGLGPPWPPLVFVRKGQTLAHESKYHARPTERSFGRMYGAIYGVEILYTWDVLYVWLVLYAWSVLNG